MCIYVHIYVYMYVYYFIVKPVVKNPPANGGDVRGLGSIPGSGRSPGVENGNPLQYSCLESFKGRGVWKVIVHGVTGSQTWLSTHIHTHI